jgi:hypothetical protein
MNASMIDNLQILLIVILLIIVIYYGFVKTSPTFEKATNQSVQQMIENYLISNPNVPVELAFAQKMIEEDPDYAWVRFCDLVLNFVEEGCDELPSMRAAARFIYTLTYVDISQDERYIDKYKQISEKESVK